MRKGPHPLPIHLGMIASRMANIQGYAAPSGHCVSKEDAIAMVRGIKMYQEHEFVSKPLPLYEVWRDGGVAIKSIYPLGDTSQAKIIDFAPLLLIPSLINKAHILDITADQSMLRWLNDRDINTYLLDWGDFNHKDDKNIDMDLLIQEKILGAISYLSESHERPIDILGYCMGGTLSVAGCFFAKDYVRRLLLLASPWDFHDRGFKLGRDVRIGATSILPVVKERGILPANLIQALFASLDPEGSAQKFIKFASMDQSSSEAKLFVSVEDWLNDGIDLPGKVADHCIQDWFKDNKTIEGNWCIGGDNIDVSMISQDVLIMASSKDRLVPFECAASIAQDFKNANVNIVQLSCGHVGLIAGKNAKKDIWQRILDWLQEK